MAIKKELIEKWRVKCTKGNFYSDGMCPDCRASHRKADELAALLAQAEAPASQRLSEHLESLIKCWLEFYRHLPNGEYKGLGEMRLAVAAAAANRNAEEYRASLVAPPAPEASSAAQTVCPVRGDSCDAPCQEYPNCAPSAGSESAPPRMSFEEWYESVKVHRLSHWDEYTLARKAFAAGRTIAIRIEKGAK